MHNKARTRALKWIDAEEVAQTQQPVKGISYDITQAYLHSMAEKIRADNRKLETLLYKKGFVQCLDANEGYYQVPYRYCYNIHPMYSSLLFFIG